MNLVVFDNIVFFVDYVCVFGDMVVWIMYVDLGSGGVFDL